MSDRFLTIPNILTVLRIILVPVTLILICKDLMLWALLTFLVACGTDMIDGHIARKYNMISKIGIWLDPLADKLMALGVVVTFAFCKIIPFWVLFTLLGKELIMLIGGVIIMHNGFSTPSNKYGKIAAFIMNASVAACFIYQLPWWNDYYLYFLYFGLALSVSSMVQYAVKNAHLLFEKNTENSNVQK